MPLRKTTFNIAAAANATLITGAGSFFSIDVKEITAGPVPGTITFYDNVAAAGAVVGVIRVAADGSAHYEWERGVKLTTGLTVAAAGADVVGSVTIGGVGLAALTALPFAGADLQLSAGPRRLDSVLIAETAGAAAEWRMFDNPALAGVPFVGSTLAANQTQKIGWPVGGISLDLGLFYDQQGGASSGAAYVY